MAKGRPRKSQSGDVLLRSAELIGWAIGGLEREIVETRQKLEALTRQAAQLRSRVPGSRARGKGPAAAGTLDQAAGEAERPAKRRQMSAAARKRISDMQKKRWAEWRKKKAGAQK
jgi:hypothetical protein